MGELLTTFAPEIEISKQLHAFANVIAEAATKLGLGLAVVRFNHEIARTEDPEDGTITVKVAPTHLMPAFAIGLDAGSKLYALTRGKEIAYTVRTDSRGGEIVGDGDQTLYTDIVLTKLGNGIKPKYLQTKLKDQTNPHFSYHFKQNWVALENTDEVQSEQASLRIDSLEYDAFFEEILAGVGLVPNPTT
jgi:hypothetical protein